MGKIFNMSQPEIKKLEIVKKVIEKRIYQREGAEILGIGLRHMQRLIENYRKHGVDGLISKQRGNKSNRELPQELKDLALSLIKKYYYDFKPTFATEKLNEIHKLSISKETVRKLMIEHELWIPRKQCTTRAYQPRYRRACIGELIQIDGSPHHWFENDDRQYSLLLAIDDATSKIMAAHFAPSESTLSYFKLLDNYIKDHGKPIAFYSDKHGIFRVNHKNRDQEINHLTQFGRALTELNIDIICANSPQAKGKVERAYSTLQERLPKEFRLRNIKDIDAANTFLPAYIEEYNRRFGKPAYNDKDMHRELLSHEKLDNIICWKEDRSVSQNLTFQYNKVLYLIDDNVDNRQLKGKRVTVHDFHDGHIELFCNNKPIEFTLFYDKLGELNSGEVVDNKRLDVVLEFAKKQQKKRQQQRSQRCPSQKHLGKNNPRINKKAG